MNIKIEFDDKCCDFFKLSKQEQNPQKKIRLIALGQLKNGEKIKMVAKRIGVDRHAVDSRWYKSFKKKGVEGLANKPRPGRTPKISKDKEQAFLNEVENIQNKRSGGRVTGNDIQKLAKDLFNADYANRSIYIVLKRLGYSWITARSKHPKSDIKAQEAFKKTLHKRLLKSYQMESI